MDTNNIRSATARNGALRELSAFINAAVDLNLAAAAVRKAWRGYYSDGPSIIALSGSAPGSSSLTRGRCRWSGCRSRASMNEPQGFVFHGISLMAGAGRDE